MTEEIIAISKLENEAITEKGKSDYKDYLWEREFWKHIEGSETPFDTVEERVGWKDKQGNEVMVEYQPEEYVIGELNRLFPGWWVEKMKRSSHEEIIALQAVITEGYLMCPYPTPTGMKVRKIWAEAGNEVTFQSGTKTPVDITNTFKGSRTEWIRIAGKWLGIGLDIYHQKITPALRSHFEDIIRGWDKYAEHWVAVAKQCETGKTFRAMLKSMPRKAQADVARLLIPKLAPDKQDGAWGKFASFSNATEEKRKELSNWLDKLNKVIININKETSNE